MEVELKQLIEAAKGVQEYLGENWNECFINLDKAIENAEKALVIKIK